MLAFLSPLFLAGLAGAALPYVIHRLNRKRSRRLPFSTLRFLFAADQRSARLHRVTDRLALLFRTLALIFVALALAQPVWRARGGLSSDMALGLVVDNSMSMGLSAGGQSAFQRAIETAREVLATRGAHDVAVAELTSGKQNPVVHGPTARFADLSAALGTLEPGPTASVLAPAIRKAMAQLDNQNLPSRQILVLTDFQHRAMDELETLHDAPDIKKWNMRFVDCSVGRVPDAGVRIISVSPKVAWEGAEATCQIEAENNGPKPLAATLSLWVDGEKRAERTLTLAPNATHRESIPFILRKAAGSDSNGGEVTSLAYGGSGASSARGDILRIEAKLSPDALAANDVAFDTVRLAPPGQVLIAEDEEARALSPDPGFFLETALSLVGPSPGGGVSPLTVHRVDASNLASESLTECRAVILVGPPLLDVSAADSLSRFIRSGGLLVVFAGGGDFSLADIDSDLHIQFDPVAESENDETEPVEPGSNQALSFALGGLADATFLEDVGLVRWRAVKEDSLSGRDRILWRARSGKPLWVRVPLGEGTVDVFGFLPHPAWTSLPIKPLFVPLMINLALGGEMSGGVTHNGGPIEAGRSVAVSLPAKPAAPPRIISPDGVAIPLLADSAVSGRFVSPPLNQTGFWQLEPPNSTARGITKPGQSVPNRIWAVNTLPEEGSQERLSPKEIRKKLSFMGNSVICESPAEAENDFRVARVGLSFAPFLWMLALFCLLAETFLATAAPALRERAFTPLLTRTEGKEAKEP